MNRVGVVALKVVVLVAVVLLGAAVLVPEFTQFARAALN